jgi:hypothetical protein
MAPTTLAMSRRPPPSGVIVNLMTGPTGTVPQVSRRETCKCVSAGFVVLGRGSGGGAGSLRDGVAGSDWSSSECSARRLVAGAGLLESVEARRDVGDGRAAVVP